MSRSQHRWAGLGTRHQRPALTSSLAVAAHRARSWCGPAERTGPHQGLGGHPMTAFSVALWTRCVLPERTPWVISCARVMATTGVSECPADALSRGCLPSRPPARLGGHRLEVVQWSVLRMPSVPRMPSGTAEAFRGAVVLRGLAVVLRGLTGGGALERPDCALGAMGARSCGGVRSGLGVSAWGAGGWRNCRRTRAPALPTSSTGQSTSPAAPTAAIANAAAGVERGPSRELG